MDSFLGVLKFTYICHMLSYIIVCVDVFIAVRTFSSQTDGYVQKSATPLNFYYYSNFFLIHLSESPRAKEMQSLDADQD